MMHHIHITSPCVFFFFITEESVRVFCLNVSSNFFFACSESICIWGAQTRTVYSTRFSFSITECPRGTPGLAHDIPATLSCNMQHFHATCNTFMQHCCRPLSEHMQTWANSVSDKGIVQISERVPEMKGPTFADSANYYWSILPLT